MNQLAGAGVVGAVLVAIWLGSSGVARAALTLDQSYAPSAVTDIGTPVSGTGLSIGQTFTVGLSVTLAEVDVRRTADVNAALSVQVRPVDATATPVADDTAVRAAVSVPAASVSVNAATSAGPCNSGVSYVDVDLSSADVAVTPGEVRAITLQSAATTGGYDWALTLGDPGPMPTARATTASIRTVSHRRTARW